MDSNHQFGLPYHAVTIHSETPASLKTHNNFNAHSARRTLWCRSHSPKELPASRVDKWHNDRSLSRHPNVLPPGQKLRDAVDLVVMATVREREHFAQEFGMPVSVFCEVDLSRLELGGLRRLPIHLLDDRPDADGTDQTCGHGVSQILQQAHARPRVLDQDGAGLCCWARAMTFRRRSGYSSRPRNRSKR